jgi:hypothetical protein
MGPSFSPTKIHPSELAEALSARVAVADTTGDCTAVSTSAERQYFIYISSATTIEYALSMSKYFGFFVDW